MGVRRVTVSTPFLLELVKRRFPAFKVRVGIYAQVNTPRRARFWEDLGADAIVLESISINRNFRQLAAIRKAVHCDLELIANHVCLLNCPMQTYHQNGFAHASDDSNTLFLDDCLMRCSRLRMTDPSLFIKSAWIRPEDIAVYEAMGYTSFKLLDLARLQGWLSPLPECPVRVEARKIPDNFLDGFRIRDCASMDCRTCGYCERIAANAVSIAPEYRAKVLDKYAEMDATMATGRLWGV